MRGDRYRRAPISRLLRPAAASSATCSCCAVNGSAQPASCRGLTGAVAASSAAARSAQDDAPSRSKGRQRHPQMVPRPGDVPGPAQPLPVQQVYPGQIERPAARFRVRESGLEQPGRAGVRGGQRGDGPGQQRLARFQGPQRRGHVGAVRRRAGDRVPAHTGGRERRYAVSVHGSTMAPTRAAVIAGSALAALRPAVLSALATPARPR